MFSCESFSPLVGKAPVCAPLTFDVNVGDVVGIVGGESSGKSACLAALSGSLGHQGSINGNEGACLYQVGDVFKPPGMFSKGKFNMDLLAFAEKNLGVPIKGFKGNDCSRGQQQLANLIRFLATARGPALLDTPILNLDVLIITSLANHLGDMLTMIDQPCVMTASDRSTLERFTTNIVELTPPELV